MCFQVVRGGYFEQGQLQEQRGLGVLKPLAYDKAVGKAVECSPTDFEWHLLLQNKIIAYSAGQLDSDRRPPNRGKGAVPESARRWGPALILGAAMNPWVVRRERTKESGPLSGTLLALYVCYSPLNSSNSPEGRMLSHFTAGRLEAQRESLDQGHIAGKW